MELVIKNQAAHRAMLRFTEKVARKNSALSGAMKPRVSTCPRRPTTIERLTTTRCPCCGRPDNRHP